MRKAAVLLPLLAASLCIAGGGAYYLRNRAPQPADEASQGRLATLEEEQTFDERMKDAYAQIAKGDFDGAIEAYEAIASQFKGLYPDADYNFGGAAQEGIHAARCMKKRATSPHVASWRSLDEFAKTLVSDSAKPSAEQWAEHVSCSPSDGPCYSEYGATTPEAVAASLAGAHYVEVVSSTAVEGKSSVILALDSQSEEDGQIHRSYAKLSAISGEPGRNHWLITTITTCDNKEGLSQSL